MDDILLSHSNADALERLFEDVKKALLKWGLQIALEKIQRGESVNYLGYKTGLQKIRTQKAQTRRDGLRTLNDFQRLLGDISSLGSAVGITSELIVHLNKTLDGDKDLNSPRELTAKAEKELLVIEEKLQEAHVDE